MIIVYRMHLLDHSPKLEINDAEKLALSMYGVCAIASTLPSERDQNFLLTTESGEKFVLKIANALEDRSLLEAQNAMMTFLESRVRFCQRVLKTLSDVEIGCVESKPGYAHFVRLVDYLPGTPLAKADASKTVLYDLGRKLGKLDHALSGFDHPALHRHFHWDLKNGPEVVMQYASLIDDPKLRTIVYNCAANVESNKTVRQLRRSIIHGDANDYNVIVDGSSVNGLIDFGDAVYSYTVGDLAVAMAYVVLDKAEPLRAAAYLVAGYYEQYPLMEEEFGVLFDLMLMRLCMSVCHAQQQRQAQPENEYLNISQRAVVRALPVLALIDRAEAEKVFRQAVNGVLHKKSR